MNFHKPELNRILFATDFSENADRAFGCAASLADAHNAVVTVLHVLEEIPPKAELMIRLFDGYESGEELQAFFSSSPLFLKSGDIRPMALSTTRRTSETHQRPFGFFNAQSHPPAFFSDKIRSSRVDLPFCRKSSSISATV